MNILEDLYRGNIEPWSKEFDKQSAYGRLVKIIADTEKELTALTKERQAEQRLLTQLIQAQNNVLDFCQLEYFIEGFQLGANFMLDTFVTPQKSVLRDTN